MLHTDAGIGNRSELYYEIICNNLSGMLQNVMDILYFCLLLLADRLRLSCSHSHASGRI